MINLVMWTCLNVARLVIMMICGIRMIYKCLDGHFDAKTTKLLFMVTLILQKPTHGYFD